MQKTDGDDEEKQKPKKLNAKISFVVAIND